MKITFLGTADGKPRKGHHQSATMVEIGERIYLFDAGAPVVDILLDADKNLEKIKGFFNTHAHSDHLNGLPSLMEAALWKKETDYDLYLAEEETITLMEAILPYTTCTPIPKDRLRMHTITGAGLVSDDGYLRVTAIPNAHMGERPSYSFLIEGEGKRVLLTGDMSYLLGKGDFPVVDGELDLLITEMAHFSDVELAPYLEKSNAKMVAIHHYQERRLPEIANLTGEGRFPFPVLRAEDGMMLEIV